MLREIEELRNKPPVTTHDALAALLARVHLRMGSKYGWFVGVHEDDEIVYLYIEHPTEGRDEMLRTIVEDAGWESLVQVGRGVYPTGVPEQESAVVVVFCCEEGWLDGLTSPDRGNEMYERASALEGVCEEAFASTVDA